MSAPRSLAEERATRIRDHLETAAAGLQEAAGLVAEAYQARDWEVLGYESWAAYCTGEFALARLKLPEGDRERIIEAFAAAGLSSRAVAAALGTSQSTAARELRTDRTPPPGSAARWSPAAAAVESNEAPGRGRHMVSDLYR